jgi:hypothetical protein
MPSEGLYNDWRNYRFALQVGRITADESMRKAGRERWGEEDWDAALSIVSFLMQHEKLHAKARSDALEQHYRKLYSGE